MPNKDSCDSKQIELGLELIRMAQARVHSHGVRLENELARQVAEVAIIMQSEERDFILDEGATISQSNVLSGALGVNDVVVNGRQIDVRPLVAGNGTVAGGRHCVSIDRLLIGTPYLANGSLVVQLDANRPGVGCVVGYVTPSAWLKAEETQKGVQYVQIPIDPQFGFDLARQLDEIGALPVIKLPSISKLTDVKSEVSELVNGREKLISARQKQIFAFISTNWSEEMLATVESVPVDLSSAKIQRVLTDSVRWQSRVELLVERLAGHIPELGKEEIRAQVLKAGERWGSQLTAPRYRRALLAELVALSLAKKTARSPVTATINRAQALAEKVLSGISALDAVKNVIGNQMAVDLAFAIHKERMSASISGLIAASAEELGVAYGKLALSPAYATHSQGEESGLESINEALALIEASSLAESVKAIEMDLANL